MDQDTATKAEGQPTLHERVRRVERNVEDHEYARGVTEELLQQICKELDIAIPEFRRPPSIERAAADHRPGRY